MNKRIKILLYIFNIAIVMCVVLFTIEKSNNPLTGAHKKIYNIYKEEAVSNNLESVKDTAKISIMSYNIHRGKDFEDRYSIEEIINYLEESDADIICLQEVLFSHHQLLRELGNYESQFVANIDIPIASTGLATYSKYPIVESNHITLTSKTEQRGALHTVYNINDKLVNVINVHLGLDRKERVKQVKELLEYSKDLEGEVIITGDFNQDPLKIEGFRDVGKYHGYDNKNTFIPKDVRIDYLFMTTEDMYSTGYEIEDVKYSDHYPIIANIKYKPKKKVNWSELDNTQNENRNIYKQFN